MKFGAMVMASLEIDEIVDLAVRAEELGFESFWLNDADVLYWNSWPIFSVIAKETRRIKIGPCVTNLVTRPWVMVSGMLNSLQEISGGRMLMGVGRGDAAVRVLGKEAMSPRSFRESLLVLRAFLAGEAVEWDGVVMQTRHLAAKDVPFFGAGYGPAVLRIIGEVCEGAIVQSADPVMVTWSRELLDAGVARRIGACQGSRGVELMVAAPGYVDDDVERACDQVRWFGRVVGHHIADLVAKSKVPVPPEIARVAQVRDARNRPTQLELVSGEEAAVPSDVIRRLTFVGPAETHVARVAALQAHGVDRCTLYLNHDGIRRTIEEYGRHVIPAVNGMEAGGP